MLQDRVDVGRMREVACDVPLSDMVDLFAADVKYTIVSFLECLDCGRLLEWGLCIRGAPIFAHVDPSALEAVRWDEVPDRSKWLGAASLAAMDAGTRLSEIRPAVTDGANPRGATPAPRMDVVTGQPNRWFLLQRGVELFLAAPHQEAADDNSLLFRLNASEKADYHRRGEAYLDELVAAMHSEALAPGGGFSPRDLYRGSRGPRYREQVAQGIRRWRNSPPL